MTSRHEAIERCALDFTVDDGQPTPEGFGRLIGDVAEVWANPDTGALVVLGSPPEDDDEDQGHNCDAMGCGSVGHHVLLQVPALPADEPGHVVHVALEGCRVTISGGSDGWRRDVAAAFRIFANAIRARSEQAPAKGE